MSFADPAVRVRVRVREEVRVGCAFADPAARA